MDLLFHMVILVMLGLTAGVDRRRALMLAPTAIIPDLDVLLVAHRVYLHTVFIPVTIAILGLFLFNSNKELLFTSLCQDREFSWPLYIT